MGCYFGEEAISTFLVEHDMPSNGEVMFTWASGTKTVVNSSGSAVASITLPSVPKWYKCYECNYSVSEDSSVGYTKYLSQIYDVANKVQDDLSETDPTITNGGKTFSKSKYITSGSSSIRVAAVQVIMLIYIL